MRHSLKTWINVEESKLLQLFRLQRHPYYHRRRPYQRRQTPLGLVLVAAVMAVLFTGFAYVQSQSKPSLEPELKKAPSTAVSQEANELLTTIRNSRQLQQRSWDNGLEILETLDGLHESLAVLGNIENMPSVSTHKIPVTRRTVEKHLETLNNLLTERKALETLASQFKVPTLYAPVYQETLDAAMKKASRLGFTAALLESAEPAERTHVVAADKV